MRKTRFNRYRVSAMFLLVAAGFAAGCATPLKEPTQLSCAQIDKEIMATEQARREAVEKQEDPFKFVTPLAAGGVHVASKSAVSSADRRLAELREESRTKGCARHA